MDCCYFREKLPKVTCCVCERCVCEVKIRLLLFDGEMFFCSLDCCRNWLVAYDDAPKR